MNKILVEVSVGELLDKISILEIKQEKIKDPEKLKFINDEHSILKDQLDNNVKSDEKLNTLFKSLKDINAKLWVIEDDKRLCEKNSDFTDEVAKEFLNRDLTISDISNVINENKNLIKYINPFYYE
mgnify:CR=1 FL=1